MGVRRSLSVYVLAFVVLIGAGLPAAHGANTLTLHGVVESDGTGLEGYRVSLLASFVGPLGYARVLGQSTSGPLGGFEIDYKLPRGLPSRLRPVLLVRARKGPVMLVSAIGRAPVVGPVVVNERTTVATGFAFAQFVKGSKIKGNRYGMLNAVHMAANMANPKTGRLDNILRFPPNGPETSARATFNSLANIVAYCVVTEIGCQDLFDATTLPGGPQPRTVLQAVANIAKFPWLNVGKLFRLSFKEQIYGPALTPAERPDAWALFLKFTGSFASVQDENNLMNGPGNFAIDRKGFLWVSDNYVPEKPTQAACAGMRLLKFYPWGENFPGSPYFGGGLSGAGFGISIAPNGLIWVGNFGFAGRGCPQPPADSVSVFRPDGIPFRPRRTPFTRGPISWPQATVADRKGNIWIANCESDSVTVYPKGRPRKAINLAIPTLEPVKPFAITIDHKGNAWVTGSFDSSLTVYGPTGDLVEFIPAEGPLGVTHLRRPMGIASDSQGNIWVANSDWMDTPCPPGLPDLGPGTSPSIALYHRHPNREAHVGSPFTGGGLSLPWGIAVDGNDTVWVANFGFPFDLGDPDNTERWDQLNRVSHFCGVDTSKCPLTKQGVGTPISPKRTGYSSNALVRNTGITIDPSGNVWLVNNWKEIPLQRNPGGNSIVVMVGAAAPLKTPLIGPPRSFNRRHFR